MSQSLSGIAAINRFRVEFILNSDQQQSAETGLALLRKLTELSRGLIIMAGVGVRLTNLYKFVQSRIQELHSAVGQFAPFGMRYRKAGVSESADNEADWFKRYQVEGQMVANMKYALTALPVQTRPV